MFKKHMFICTNQKIDSVHCCAGKGSEEIFNYALGRCKELGIFGPQKMRVSKSGCMGQCAKGPTVVIYPDATWYTCSSTQEMEHIIQSHLINDIIRVELLMDE